MATDLGITLIPARKHADLIYDVGLHRGEDTDFYLRKGFRVVAFEANPDNDAFCQQRFAEAIARGRLTIVSGAISDPPSGVARPHRVTFYRNQTHSNWGTVRSDWAEGKERLGAPSTAIEVDAVDFGAVLEEHGIPHYLKLDVEGCELLCLETLRRFRERPDYVSLESLQTAFAHVRREIVLLSDLGYDAFQAVDQREVAEVQAPPFPSREGEYVVQRFEGGASGLFGAELPGKWCSKREILRRYRAIRFGCLVAEEVIQRSRVRGAWRLEPLVHKAVRYVANAAVSDWYDTHARHASTSS